MPAWALPAASSGGMALPLHARHPPARPTCGVASGAGRAAAAPLAAHATTRASKKRARGVVRGMAQGDSLGGAARGWVAAAGGRIVTEACTSSTARQRFSTEPNCGWDGVAGHAERLARWHAPCATAGGSTVCLNRRSAAQRSGETGPGLADVVTTSLVRPLALWSASDVDKSLPPNKLRRCGPLGQA